MKYKIDDVLIHKSNSCSKWIITSKDYKYNNKGLIIDRLYNLCKYNNNKIEYNNNMILSELEIFKYFILKDNYKTYKSQCKLKILLSYIEYYNNDLSPEFIKNDDNYVYYKLDQKDYQLSIFSNLKSVLDYMKNLNEFEINFLKELDKNLNQNILLLSSNQDWIILFENKNKKKENRDSQVDSCLLQWARF